MGARNRQDARAQMTGLLYRRLPGSRSQVRAHVARALRLSDAVWDRFQLSVSKFRLKHLRWYLRHRLGDLGVVTRYEHWLTVVRICAALDHADEWKPLLEGPWSYRDGVVRDDAPCGGRPMRLPPPRRVPQLPEG